MKRTFICEGCGETKECKSYSYNYKNKYCSNACQAALKRKKRQERDLRLFGEGKLANRTSIFEILVVRDGDRCDKCGITEWQNSPIRFWVDHINGNASDNSPNNLRLVCPNCDSQSDTFGAKNRGNGRKAHGIETHN